MKVKLEDLLKKFKGAMKKDMTHLYSDGFRAGLKVGYINGKLEHMPKKRKGFFDKVIVCGEKEIES